MTSYACTYTYIHRLLKQLFRYNSYKTEVIQELTDLSVSATRAKIQGPKKYFYMCNSCQDHQAYLGNTFVLAEICGWSQVSSCCQTKCSRLPIFIIWRDKESQYYNKNGLKIEIINLKNGESEETTFINSFEKFNYRERSSAILCTIKNNKTKALVL